MKFVHVNEVIECCQVEAIANKLDPSPTSRLRRLCRDYSKKFHTPYHEVLQLDIEFVILAIYEEQLDDLDSLENLELLMDRVYSIEDPNYEKHKEYDIQQFIKDAEEEEQERLRTGKPVFQKKKKQVAKQPVESPKLGKELPKSGGINLSYLERQDQEE